MNVIATLPQSETEQTEREPSLSAMDRHVRRRLFRLNHLIALIVLVIVLAVAGYTWLRFGQQSTLSVPAARVTVSAVQVARFLDHVPVIGTVSPLTSVYLDTIEGGQVTEVLVDEGTWVEDGELLARLTNTRLELEMLGQETQVAEQQNRLASERLTFAQNEVRNRRERMTVEFEIRKVTQLLERRRGLSGSVLPAAEIADLEIELAHNGTLLAALEEAHAEERALALHNLDRAQQGVDRMTERLELVQQNLGNLTLTAPISGQLTVFDLNAGAVVSAGQRIGQVDTVGAFKITALVDEFYLGRVAMGQSASVDIAARTYDLEVAKVYPNVRDRQFQVDLVFTKDAPAGLRRGQTLRPRIELGEAAESLVLANGSYVDETGGLWVFVVSPDGAMATRRDVSLGRRNPEMVEVLSGLNAGERVVVSSYHGYRDYDRIDFN